MRGQNHIGSLVALVLALLPVSARGEEPARPVEATAHVGYVQTGGNTQLLAVLADEKIRWKSGRWVLGQDAAAVYGRDHSIENAGRYGAALRGEYGFTPHISALGIVAWQRNRFGGIERRFDESLGLLVHALIPKPRLLDVELGAGLVQRETIAREEQNFATGRLGTLFRQFFTEKAYAEASGIWVLNLEDTGDSDAEGRLALVAPLAGRLFLNLGWSALYRTRPVAGLEKLDWTTSAGLEFTY